MSASDEREITAVITRYATAIDRRDWDLFRTCFTEELRADYGSLGQWKSAAEITAFMVEAHADVGLSLHRLTNFVIDVRGERATARTYVDTLLMPGAPGSELHRGIGYYDDELVKTGQGWRIRARRWVPVRIV